MAKLNVLKLVFLCLVFSGCEKEPTEPEPDPKPVTSLTARQVKVNGISNGLRYENLNLNPQIEILFSDKVNRQSAVSSVRLTTKSGSAEGINIAYKNDDSTLVITSSQSLSEFSSYVLTAATTLKSISGSSLSLPVVVNLVTALDSTDKFPVISDNELLTLVQRQTFKYFWDFGHPTSGMARERSTSGNVVTTGGTGFGIMAMVAATERKFVTREDAVARIQKITSFLKDKCTPYHGAFAHWVNGETGQTQPFSQKDNGADLVETSFLFEGLLTARQYFNGNTSGEMQLRKDITTLWEAVEWDWFQREGENVLYWHWSPDYTWEMNHQIRGWNECLITYVLAASSPTHPISKQVYDEGWARNGAMKNGGTYFGYALPLGEAFGGPLFFAHYSFLGLNPKGLSDTYADYWVQNTNHSKINYSYCVQNPGAYLGYSADCWGLTASDDNNGYSAHSPTNDKGVITPTAALSSMPYTPEESMKALHFFYYKLGNRLWKDYGFVDAFNPTANWYDNQFLAIDQGPIVVMIENYRTGLIWNTFMTCPEIQSGLIKLGFTSGQK